MTLTILQIIITMFTGSIFSMLILGTYNFYYLNLLQLILLLIIFNTVSYSYISLMNTIFHLNIYMSNLIVIILGLFVYKLIGGKK